MLVVDPGAVSGLNVAGVKCAHYADGILEKRPSRQTSEATLETMRLVEDVLRLAGNA